MFCTNCGKQVSDLAVQCEHCGANLTASRKLEDVNESSPFSETPTGVFPEEQQTRASPAVATSASSMTGRVLGGRYQLDAWIGGGGMGAIYKARRLHIGDTVAVKVLRPEVVNDLLSRERFHREARAAAMLNHPNAVVIHDFGEDADGTAYIVMEFLEGKSLRQILIEERTLSPERSYSIIRQACAALEAAHKRGIIHRDIKPDNIILGNNDDLTDHVKILDFGIAKLRDKAVDTISLEKSLTTVGTVIGTPHYMSPEQCQGESADARSDIYSLGVVIYEMLTGAVPFTAKTPTGVAVKHVTEIPRPLSEILLGIAPAVDRLALRALAKNPDDRQQSALELAREFDTAVQSGSMTSKAAVVETMAINNARKNSGNNDPAGDEVFVRSASTNVNPASNNRSFETQIAKASPVSSPALLPGSKKSFPVIAVGAGILTLALIGAAFFLYRSRQNQTPVVIATPTPVVVTPATPTPPPTPPVAPEGMVYIKGGDFVMGRDDDGPDQKYERPSTPTSVKPYFIDLTEVTSEAYLKFTTATGHPAPLTWPPTGLPETDGKLPVTGVTWEDASRYAEWAGKRLPTEAEWEYAARGNSRQLYPWGVEWEAGRGNDAENQARKPRPVGNFPNGKSPFDLLDMAGNVWEWTASDFTPYPGATWIVPDQFANSKLKVLRGGAFDSKPGKVTVTTRSGWPMTMEDWPATSKPDYSKVGFRCAQDAPVQ